MVRSAVLNTLFFCFLLLVVYLTSFYSFLLFHSIAEAFSILIAGSVFFFAWNARKYLEDGYFLFLGIAYLFVAMIDFAHMLSYKGMGIFSEYDANLPTQLWIAARYMESIALVVAFRFFKQDLKHHKVLLVFIITTLLIFASIFYWKLFPDCFIEGKGLTPFKIYSEYLIAAILMAAMFLLRRHRDRLDDGIYYLLISSIVLTVTAELAFSFYVSVYGLSNLIGHFCKIISFYLIYKAIIETGFKKPYDLLFRELKRHEKQLQLSKVALQHSNAELMVENTERKQIEKALQAEKTLTDTAINAQMDTFLVFDLEDGKAIRWNTSFAELTGYSDQEIQTFKAPDHYFSEIELEELREKLQEVLTVGTATLVLNLIRKTGEHIPMEFNISLMILIDPTKNYFLAVGRDITQRLEAEALIRASLQEKETLLHEIHHRVKNNLAVISSLLSLQARQTSSEEAIEVLKDSKSRIQAMARIHETLYKAEDLSLIEMQEYLLSLVKSLYSSFGNLSGRVQYSVEAGNLLLNVGQATALGLIVNELVTNVLKYAFPGEKNGIFSVQLLSDGGNGYQMSVNDNGVGFPPTFNGHTADSLGLKLVRLLAENQLGGIIEFRNVDGAEIRISFSDEH